MTRQSKPHSDGPHVETITRRQPRGYHAAFAADAVTVFVGKRTERAFSWLEVPVDVLVNARNNEPILLVANQIGTADEQPPSWRGVANRISLESRRSPPGYY